MRTGLDNYGKPGTPDYIWFTAAIILGALWGFSAEPVYLPAAMGAGAGLKFYGWMLVGVLCLCLGLMGWIMLHEDSEHLFHTMQLKPGPLTVMAMPNIRAPQAPEPPPAPPPAARAQPAAPPVQESAAELPLPAKEWLPSKEAAAPPPANPHPPDPFLAALDYLGHAQATVRIGGILALERIVRQGGDKQSCVGTLVAYIQQWTEVKADRKRPAYDVGAALAVLTRLLPSDDALRNLAGLQRVHLAGLELTDADMSHFHFEHADLSGADLRGGNFSGVNFRGADLRGAQLAGAIFPGASFRGADLTGAILSDEEFGAADLSMAGNISATQMLHVRYLPGRPPRLPAGMQLPGQASAIAV